MMPRLLASFLYFYASSHFIATIVFQEIMIFAATDPMERAPEGLRSLGYSAEYTMSL